ncbi:MAG: helicase-related protein, partial [Cetobacterium sp.]
PNRDELGSQIINEILGEIVFEFSMKEAIDEGFLCKYYYYPVLVELTETERCKYYELTEKINKLSWLSESKNEDILKYLLIKRSRLIQLAENKLNKLNKLLKNDNRKNNLVYVGSGKRDNEIEESEEKEIEKITRMLGNELGKNVAKFTAEENEERRNEIIDSFKNEHIDTIVAIKCLDEGVNIPSIENAYILGSTTNEREYIQRRGRILRLYKNKEFAYIYDFIVVPTHYKLVGSLESDIFNIDRNLLKKELKRVKEYSSLCENRFSFWGELYEYKKVFNLVDI